MTKQSQLLHQLDERRILFRTCFMVGGENFALVEHPPAAALAHDVAQSLHRSHRPRHPRRSSHETLCANTGIP
ncbi:hypothetical protein [Sphingopyxis fribergensis]